MKENRMKDAVASGDRLEALYTLRDLLAERLDATKSGRDTASISLRLMDCLREIDELEGKQPLDNRAATLYELQERVLKRG